MGSHSREEEIAMSLAAAVANYAAEDTRPRPLPSEIEGGLHDLLYGVGGDAITELSVAESQPTCMTIVGLVTLLGVRDPTLSPFEAEFRLDKAGGGVTVLTIRAGDRRIAGRDRAGDPQVLFSDAPYIGLSWRKMRRMIENRPTADEDWEHILHYKFD